jgi:hypothetical protein
MLHDANMCIKKKILKFFNNCKIELVQWWWINSYSHNTNKPQSNQTNKETQQEKEEKRGKIEKSYLKMFFF